MDQVKLPSVYCSLSLYYDILLREDIDIVHVHSSHATFTLEAIYHSRALISAQLTLNGADGFVLPGHLPSDIKNISTSEPDAHDVSPPIHPPVETPTEPHHQATSRRGVRVRPTVTVLTEHSLFGSCTLECIIMNSLIQVTAMDLDAAVAVSYATRANLLERCAPFLSRHRVHVVPNSVDADDFLPDPTRRPADRSVLLTLYK